MATDEFAERYMATIKAPFHLKETYIKNLVVLVMIVKQCTHALNEYLKTFIHSNAEKVLSGNI